MLTLGCSSAKAGTSEVAGSPRGKTYRTEYPSAQLVLTPGRLSDSAEACTSDISGSCHAKYAPTESSLMLTLGCSSTKAGTSEVSGSPRGKTDRTEYSSAQLVLTPGCLSDSAKAGTSDGVVFALASYWIKEMLK
jgi:hypothetical protein